MWRGSNRATSSSDAEPGRHSGLEGTGKASLESADMTNGERRRRPDFVESKGHFDEAEYQRQAEDGRSERSLILTRCHVTMRGVQW